MRSDEFYEKYYSEFQGRGLQSRYIAFSHRFLERCANYSARRILEIGAGKGEHVRFVMPGYREYVLTDIRDMSKIVDLPDKTTFVQANAENLPFMNDSFDRIIGTCVLHHLDTPQTALQEMLRVWDKRGVISLQVPTDPHFLYVSAKKLFVNGKWKQYGFESPLAEHWEEHKNHFLGIDSAIKKTFSAFSIERRFWPVPFLHLPSINLFAVYRVTCK